MAGGGADGRIPRGRYAAVWLLDVTVDLSRNVQKDLLAIGVHGPIVDEHDLDRIRLERALATASSRNPAGL